MERDNVSRVLKTYKKQNAALKAKVDALGPEKVIPHSLLFSP